MNSNNAETVSVHWTSLNLNLDIKTYFLICLFVLREFIKALVRLYRCHTGFILNGISREKEYISWYPFLQVAYSIALNGTS